MDTLADEDLTKHIAKGDRRALEVLYARHRVKGYRFLLRLTNNEATAEDTLSDVFFDVWQQAGRFEARSSVSTWLFAIASFKALSARRERQHLELGPEEEMIEDPGDDPENLMQKVVLLAYVLLFGAELTGTLWFWRYGKTAAYTAG